MMYLPWQTANEASRDIRAELLSMEDRSAIVSAVTLDRGLGAMQIKVPSEPLTTYRSGLYVVRAFEDGRMMRLDVAARKYTPISGPRLMMALDSNIYGKLANVVLRNRASDEDRDIVRNLLETSIAMGAELQPAPYIIEMTARNDVAEAEADARSVIEAALRVNGMDRAIYLATGSIEPLPAAIDMLVRHLGTDDFTRAAELEARRMFTEPKIGGTYVICYLCILELITLGIEMRHKSIDAKIAAYDSYLVDVLHVANPRLMIIGRLFFHRKANALLKAQPGDRAVSQGLVLNAAHDVYLTMFAEQWLMISQEEPTLPILATLDQGLAAVASRLLLYGVAFSSHGLPRLLSRWDEAWFDDLLGTADADKAARINKSRDFRRSGLRRAGVVVGTDAREGAAFGGWARVFSRTVYCN